MADFVYTVKAHPTTYNGVEFRSRLEATWAAFFDLCGWPWEYEPVDLEGWSPDFIIKGSVPCLVEVKPIDFSTAPKYWWGIDAKVLAEKYAAKTFDYHRNFPSGEETEYEIMVLGTGPYFDEGFFSPWMLGVLVREVWQMNAPLPASFFYGNGRALDYATCEGSFIYRVEGEYDGDHHLKHITDDLPAKLWKQASNTTRWKGPRT